MSTTRCELRCKRPQDPPVDGVKLVSAGGSCDGKYGVAFSKMTYGRIHVYFSSTGDFEDYEARAGGRFSMTKSEFSDFVDQLVGLRHNIEKGLV